MPRQMSVSMDRSGSCHERLMVSSWRILQRDPSSMNSSNMPKHLKVCGRTRRRKEERRRRGEGEANKRQRRDEEGDKPCVCVCVCVCVWSVCVSTSMRRVCMPPTLTHCIDSYPVVPLLVYPVCPVYVLLYHVILDTYPVSQHAPTSCTRLGCRSNIINSISALNLFTASSFTSSASTRFNAHGVPRHVAAYTCPRPPCPIFFPTSTASNGT